MREAGGLMREAIPYCRIAPTYIKESTSNETDQPQERNP